MGISCLLVLSNSMSRTDPWKDNWLFIRYYWQRCSSNSSCVHSWTKSCFSISLSFALSVWSPLPYIYNHLVLALRCAHWSCYLHDFERYYYPFTYLPCLKVYKGIYLWAWSKENLVPTLTLHPGGFIIRLQVRRKSQGFPEFGNAVPVCCSQSWEQEGDFLGKWVLNTNMFWIERNVLLSDVVHTHERKIKTSQ